MPAKCVYIFQGISGSGKSTWIKKYMKLHPEHTFEICSADDFFMQNGKYIFEPKNYKWRTICAKINMKDF